MLKINLILIFQYDTKLGHLIYYPEMLQFTFFMSKSNPNPNVCSEPEKQSGKAV